MIDDLQFHPDRGAGLRHALRILIALVVVMALLLVSGCVATAPTITTVRVAVPVECRVATPERPLMPTEELRPGATLYAATQAALAEIERREGYEERLRAALGVCTAPVAAGKDAP